MGAKAERTRANLVQAARAVFAEQGYFDTKLSDITDRAGCSTGTLYTYFRNRGDILAAIIESAYTPVLSPDHSGEVVLDRVSRIRRANREYVESYRENADLMGLMDQVAHVDAGIRAVRLRRARAFVERNAQGIAKLQQKGAVDPRLDPHLVSQALSSMVSRMCFHIFVDDRENPRFHTPEGIDELVDTLTTLWVNALGLAAEPGAEPPTLRTEVASAGTDPTDPPPADTNPTGTPSTDPVPTITHHPSTTAPTGTAAAGAAVPTGVS